MSETTCSVFTSTGKVSRLRNAEEGFFKSTVGLSFSDKKIIPRNTEQTELTVFFAGIPSVSPEKTSKFRSEPFRGRENRSEFRSEFFADEKTPRNSVPNLYGKRKMLRISFWTPLWKRKTPRLARAGGWGKSQNWVTGKAPSSHSWKPNGGT
jgi:hypothetical protein